MTREQLRTEFRRLSNESNFPKARDKRQRGRYFEQLIYKLLDNEGLQPSTSFRPGGEEIDGSFILGNSVFLIEAKWNQSSMPASSIYQFKGKVDGKLIGTIGVYISISGFSSEAVDALTFGKSINIILFDNEDFATCINEENGFTKVLLKKIRVASEKGTVFFQVKSITVSSEIIGGKPKVTETEKSSTNFLKMDIRKEINQLIFIVEGNRDQQIIQAFAEKIFSKTGNKKMLNIMIAGGKYSVAKLANTIQNNLLDNSKIVLVADSDNDKEETLNLLKQYLDNKRITTIIPEPEIEIWLYDLKNTSRNEFRNLLVHKKAKIIELIEKIDIDKLITRDSSFKKFYKILTE